MSARSYVLLRNSPSERANEIEDMYGGPQTSFAIWENATIHVRLLSNGGSVGRSIYSVRLTPAGAFAHRTADTCRDHDFRDFPSHCRGLIVACGRISE
jgi:hypothetical protein